MVDAATAERYAQIAEEFSHRGFAVVRGFLSDEGLAQALHHTSVFCSSVLPCLPASRAFFSDPSDAASLRFADLGGGRDFAPDQQPTNAFFSDLCDEPRWRALADACLQEPSTADAPALFNKTAGKSGETPPHQDNHYFCLDPPNCMTIWCTLDAITEETGALRYLPGSHLEGPCREHEPSFNLGFSQRLAEGAYTDEDRLREVVISGLQPGDAIVHHSQCIHRADTNNAPVNTGVTRRAIGLVFRGVSAVVDQERYQAHLQSIEEQGLPGGGKEREKRQRRQQQEGGSASTQDTTSTPRL
jgi:phytanoyl-CoA hydroxylase|eukprot:COSAG06_NODE_8317_length_2205_cov_3.285850_1_plen_301_part_00